MSFPWKTVARIALIALPGGLAAVGIWLLVEKLRKSKVKGAPETTDLEDGLDGGWCMGPFPTEPPTDRITQQENVLRRIAEEKGLDWFGDSPDVVLTDAPKKIDESIIGDVSLVPKEEP